MEQSCVVWHGSLTAGKIEELEQGQNALRIVLKMITHTIQNIRRFQYGLF